MQLPESGRQTSCTAHLHVYCCRHLGPQQASSSRMVRQVSKPAEPLVERTAVPKATGSKRGQEASSFL